MDASGLRCALRAAQAIFTFLVAQESSIPASCAFVYICLVLPQARIPSTWMLSQRLPRKEGAATSMRCCKMWQVHHTRIYPLVIKHGNVTSIIYELGC